MLARFGEPSPTSQALGALRVKEAVAAGADAVVALCPCCQVQREPMFRVMGPMMPALFPILLPGMMPKVLPHMIARIVHG